MKTCSRCKLDKQDSQFHQRTNYCKQCKREYNKEHALELKVKRSKDHIKNKSRDNKRNRNYYKIHKKERRSYYLANIDRFKNNAAKIYYSSDGYGIAATLNNCRQRSRKYNLTCDLDKDFLLSLYLKQNGCCAITGIPFVFEKDERFSMRPFAPSLDRIDSKQGYIKNNVRFVCTAVNFSLNEFGMEIFDKICAAYIKNRNE